MNYKIKYTATYETKGELEFESMEELTKFFHTEQTHFAEQIQEEIMEFRHNIDVNYTSWNFDEDLPI